MKKLAIGAALVAPTLFCSVASATSALPESWAGAGIVSETPGIVGYLAELPMFGPGYVYASEGAHSASISNDYASAAGRADESLGASASSDGGPSGALGAAFATSTFHTSGSGGVVESSWSVDGSLTAYGEAFAGAAIGIIGWTGDLDEAYDNEDIHTFLFKSLTTDDFPEEFDEVAFKASGDYAIDFGVFDYGYSTIAAVIVAGAFAEEGSSASADFLNTFFPNIPPAPAAVPLPAAVWLFGTALAGLFGFKRRKAVA